MKRTAPCFICYVNCRHSFHNKAHFAEGLCGTNLCRVRLTWGDGPVRPVAAALARLMVVILIISVHTVKVLWTFVLWHNEKQPQYGAFLYLDVGYGMRTGCFSHRCLIMVAALLPLKPPESSSALQLHTSSARRAMFSAGKITREHKERYKFSKDLAFLRWLVTNKQWISMTKQILFETVVIKHP